MKFFTDQDVYAATVRLLSSLGHDVETASQQGKAQAKDIDLLAAANAQGRLFVTRDRDFGALVFVQSKGPGVIYLRMTPSDQDAVHAELERILTLYTEQELQASFVVVEPGRHRIRKPGSSQSQP
jgi:predicted nuclease of predicted toxin-antitoxin system